ncbi:MAG: precorrin-6Y C5,15-methyltransferase (decarboxylating) subunit CbiT [Halobacteria archaeon]|nr:precorrin-6Y C5,15-methyltransferase (decarboxylating) subunit CbiT [Halobacteria archaeon]
MPRTRVRSMAVEIVKEVSAGPTKPEVRGILLQKFNLEEDDSFLDVGSGTGAVSIEAARRGADVTAVDRREEAVESTRANVENAGLSDSVEVVHGVAPDAIAGVEPDVAFIGGSRRFESVLDLLEEKGVRKVVMNAARLETAAEMVSEFREREILEESFHIQVSKGRELVGQTAFKPNTQTYMVVGSCDGGKGNQNANEEGDE